MAAVTNKEFVGRSKPLSQAQLDRVSDLRQKGVPWKEIVRRTNISIARIMKYYRKAECYARSEERRKERKDRSLDKIAQNPSPRSAVLYSKSALYDPARDGLMFQADLTAQIMGDPPPGRREMVDKYFSKEDNIDKKKDLRIPEFEHS